MGRPRKPTAVKKLQGTLQPCRTPENEPVPSIPLRAIKPPRHLCKFARDAWKFAVEQAPEGLLTSLDFSTFEQWADVYAKILECEQVLKTEGWVVTDPDSGISKPHPMLKMQNELRGLLKIYLTELGFTPASRSRISITPKTEHKNDFIDL